jgi:ATP-dependent Clp protease protease subunit
MPPDIPWQPKPPAPSPPTPPPAPAPRPVPLFVPVEQPVPPADLWSKLLDRRIVLLAGHLDQATATRAAAEVMLLDAEGAGPVQLHISCPDGDLDASVMLAETLDLLQAPVHAIAGGLLGGAAVAVYASAGRRLAHRHAAFHLHEPRTEMAGTAEQLASRVAQHQHQVDYLHRHLARACSRDVQQVAADLHAGRLLTAAAAMDYGLVHDLAAAGRAAVSRGADSSDGPAG